MKEQQQKLKQNRLELYLKNMDLLKITPSVSIAVYNSSILDPEGVEALLQLMKNWSVCECYLYGEKEAALPFADYFKQNKNPINKNIRFFLECRVPDAHLIHEMRDTISEILHQKIFMTNQYTKLFRIWGQDVIQFYGHESEIYEINPDKKSKVIEIKYPENVLGILKSDSRPTKIAAGNEYENLINDFDRKTGKLKIKGDRASFYKIFILRNGYVFYSTDTKLELNYSNPDLWRQIKELYEQFFIENEQISLDNFYSLGKLLPEPGFNDVIIYPYKGKNPFEKPESKTVIQNFIIKNTQSDQVDAADFNLKKVFLKQFEEKILPNFNKDRKNIRLTLNNKHPWFADLINIIPIIPQIDLFAYRQKTPGETDTEINLRLLANRCHRYNIKQIPVQLNYLLSINKSFSEMKHEIDALFLAGANHIIFNFYSDHFTSKNNLIENLEEWDPNYAEYFDWFAYLHQLGHFLKLGIRRPELLVLYPSKNVSTRIFKECIAEISRTGLDFSLIDFETFNDNTLAKIEENEIIVYNHSYRIIILPGIDSISIVTIQKLNRFFAKGGIVIAIGNLPEKAFDNRKNTLLNRIKQQIWLTESEGASTMFKQHDSGGLGYYQVDTNKLSNILQDISKNLRVVLNGKYEGIKYQLREIKESYLIFFLNTNQSDTVEFNFITKYSGRPYLWDFTLGESEVYPFWHISNHKLHLKVKLAPRQSQFFIIDRKQSPKLYQIYATDLDGAKIIKQSEKSIQLEGWQRQEGHYQLKIKNSTTTTTLSYSVDKKPPILVMDTKGWYLDSDHFKGQVSLGDQSYPFPYKSCRITYHKIIILKEEYLTKKKLMLNLGKVKDWCKIYINDQFVQQILFEPFTADITPFVKTGENKISIEVTNRLANRLCENAPNLDDLITVHEYGLFGPVKIIPYSSFTLKI
jgi:hypothetical protein